MGIVIKSLSAPPKRTWRILKWACIKYCYKLLARPRITNPNLGDRPALGPFEKPSAKTLSAVVGDTPFPADEALHGTVATPDLCAQIPNGVWVEVEGRGDCIRYYAHGLASHENPRILVYFGGDVILTTSKGVRFVSASYHSQCPDRIEADMAE